MVATAQNVESVYQATRQCRTPEEIMKQTGLPGDVVDECIRTLKELGVVATDELGRTCSIEAVKTLKQKFDKICVLCNSD
jgi:hypothetical protein